MTNAVLFKNLDKVIVHDGVYFLGGQVVTFLIERVIKHKFVRRVGDKLLLTPDGEIELEMGDEEACRLMRKEMKAMKPISYTGDETEPKTRGRPPREKPRPEGRGFSRGSR